MLYVQSRTRDFSDGREHERRQAATIEIELRGTAPRHTWVAGIAVDWFAIRSRRFPSDDVPLHAARHVRSRRCAGRVVAVRLGKRAPRSPQHLRLASLSPRGSALVHRGAWAARVSAGQSYFAPTPLTEETEAAGLTRLSIDDPLEKETARSVSADLTHKTRASVVTLTVFHIAHRRSSADRPGDVHAPHRSGARRDAGRRDPRHGAPRAVRRDRHVHVPEDARARWP